MDFNAMFLDGWMRGVDSFKFFLMRSQAVIRIMVRSAGEVLIVDIAIVSGSLVRGKEALVGAEIFESVERRGGMIMCLSV
jgi:hypothetical protein